LGRSFPPSNVRSAAWYLASVALMAVPVYLLFSSTVSETPQGALDAAPEIGKLIALAAGVILVAGVLYVGFRFMYPVVLVLLVAIVGRAVFASEPQLLGILVPLPALLLLVTPAAVGWFLGTKRKVLPVAEEREFHLPQR
jgi:ABC-type polysaccharide/polyol phosphate export permease